MAGRFFSRLFGCFANGSRSDEDHPQGEVQLAPHMYGQYSTASVQANVPSEDYLQLESGHLSNLLPNGPTGVFVGIYDGHGGDFCSWYLKNNLFDHLKDIITYYQGEVDPDVIQRAYHSAENNFVAHVKGRWIVNPKLATVGSCCLTGVVHDNRLYVANAGDSRAVLASWADGDELAQVQQLSIDHNANDEERRSELEAEHPDHPNLFSVRHGSHRLKGILQVTRAIGDVFLKSNEYNRWPLSKRYRQKQQIVRPLLKFEPTVETHLLAPNNKFVIFGSDGLWGELTNEEAVSIVKPLPRNGAATALLTAALQKASQRHNMTYEELINVPFAQKRSYHDDISIVILFFDHVPLQNQ